MPKTNDFNRALFRDGRIVLDQRPPTWWLSAVGDVSLWPSDEMGPKFPLPGAFDPVRERLAAEVSYVNLEGPVTDAGKAPSRLGVRGCRPEQVEALKAVGFNMVCLANNHITDFGRQGVADTLRLLRRHKLPFHGAGLDEAQARKPRRRTVRGTKLAFLAYCRDEAHLALGDHCGAAPYDLPRVLEDVRRLRKRVDVLIVSVHTGRIGFELPRRELRDRCRLLIDEGADLILGHHPHQVQGIERYGKGLIFYSLGNFFFDLGRNPAAASQAFIARLGFRGRRIVQVEIVPVKVDGAHTILPTRGAERRDFLRYLKRISDLIIDDARFDERNWEIACAEWDRVVGRICQLGGQGDRAALDAHLAYLHHHPTNLSFHVGDYVTEFLHRHIHGLPCGRGEDPHPDEEAG